MRNNINRPVCSFIRNIKSLQIHDDITNPQKRNQTPMQNTHVYYNGLRLSLLKIHHTPYVSQLGINTGHYT